MAERIVAKKDLYLSADKEQAVSGNSPDAAFLLARKGREVPPEWTHLVTPAGNPKQPKKADTKAVQPAEDK